MNSVTIQFAKNGYVMTVISADGNVASEVFVSTGKLNKALRAVIEDYTLVTKKADVAADAE